MIQSHRIKYKREYEYVGGVGITILDYMLGIGEVITIVEYINDGDYIYLINKDGNIMNKVLSKYMNRFITIEEKRNIIIDKILK